MRWPISRLGDLVEIKGGGTPSRAKPDYWDGDIPWATVKDFKSGAILGTEEHITCSGLENSATNLIPMGTILIPSRMALGKVAIAGIEMAINQDLKALAIICPERLDRDYLFWFLKSTSADFERAGKGATVKGITLDFVKAVQVPLPPLATQCHIAKVLEQADSLRRQAQQLEAELGRLAQALFLDMFGDYRQQAAESFVPLAEVADVVSGVAKGSKLTGAVRTLPYLRVANVQDGFLDLSEIKEIEATERDIEKYRLKAGDILMTEGGDFDKLGRGAMWSGEIAECIHQNHIFRVRLSDAYEPRFFECYLRTPMVKTYFLSCAKKTTNLASINMSQLKALPTPKEPPGRQKQFVAALQKIEAQRQIARRQQAELEQAFQSLMQRAFKGELISKLA